MELVSKIIYWACYAYYLYVFGYASLFKIFQKESMVKSMQSLGFNTTWTMLIGAAEFIGVILIVVGLIKPQFRNLGILFLFPFAIGALTTHMAHGEYNHYYNSLIMCVFSVILLTLDKNFKIII
ncbi:DoxX-like family protein [Chryseobacterium soldanellicola]|uniref:DoxX-like family protein n=1 Tax=Chryseobacterium soldanellicola TaxID=311333 RepID=A0A1H1GGR0_9FLAO|nr:DoxX family protein [Chryseobacterium soldanellicola]SDR12243.1 DoxX-like family protein [Chryseobacterium soldanellicola]